jgi:aminoglycoside phosphotransferase family enzyme
MGRYDDEDDGVYTEYTLNMRRYENHDNVNDVSSTFRVKDEDLEEILQHAAYFLQGCSFTYVKKLTAETVSD